MEAAEILVLQASYTNPVHAQAIGFVLNHYAEDPMGGGAPLSADVLQNLPRELAKRPHAFSVLAFVGGEPAGCVALRPRAAAGPPAASRSAAWRAHARGRSATPDALRSGGDVRGAALTAVSLGTTTRPESGGRPRVRAR